MKSTKIMAAMLLIFTFVSTNIIISNATDFKHQEIDMTSLADAHDGRTEAALRDSIESIRQALILDVGAYIRSCAKKSRMDAAHIVDCCLERGFDIPLLLSQARQESGFGTAGERPFGMMNRRYSDPNHAVVPYIELMASKYLRTKTVDEAIRTGLYVNGSTKWKYASSPGYCKAIKSIRDEILERTAIMRNQEAYAELAEKLAEFEKTKAETPI